MLRKRQALIMSLILLPAACLTDNLRGQDDPKKELSTLKKQFETYRDETDEALETMEEKLNAALRSGQSTAPPRSDFVLTGFAFTGFTDAEGDASSFNAGLNPIFLWKLNDRFLFEGELELELEGDETHVALEFAQLSYLVSDSFTFGIGQFLNPSNYFQERLHPAWINKLPNAPLGFHGSNRLQAASHLGAQVRGAVRLGSARAEYSIYASNGGALREDNDGGAEPGTIDYANFEDSNNNKAVGGRVGFFPIPELGLGYAYETSGVATGIDSAIHAIDLNYVTRIDSLAGTLDVRSQYVWSDVDRTTYTLVSPLTGTLDYENQRDAGYFQLAYRPTGLDGSEFLSNLETVVRYDMIDRPGNSLNPVDSRRWTLGLNYWFDASTVLKIALGLEDRDSPSGNAQDLNTFMLQFGTGF